MIVSLYLPQVVPVSDFRMLIVLSALVLVIVVCFAKLSLGSNVIPRSLGCFVVGMVVLFILMSRV